MQNAAPRLGETLLIASAVRGIGQSYISAQLSYALAESGCKVVLVGSSDVMKALNWPQQAVQYVQEHPLEQQPTSDPRCPNLTIVPSQGCDQSQIIAMQRSTDYVVLDLSLSDAQQIKEVIDRTLLICTGDPQVVCRTDHFLSAFECVFAHEPELLFNEHGHRLSVDEQAHISDLLAIPTAGVVRCSRRGLLSYLPLPSSQPHTTFAQTVAHLRGCPPSTLPRPSSWQSARDWLTGQSA